jgi:hypothetical protein
MEALKSASLGRLDEEDRRRAIALLDSTGAHNSLAREVRGLLDDIDALPPAPGWFARTGAAMRTRYLHFTKSWWFDWIVNGLLLLYAVAKIVFAAAVVLDENSIKGFVEWATLASTLAAGVLIVIGAFLLPRSRLSALRWFERGLLVEIVVTQVFVFQQHQLGGLVGLTWTIIVWLLVRSAIRAERERDVLELAPPTRAPAGSVAQPVS